VLLYFPSTGEIVWYWKQ